MKCRIFNPAGFRWPSIIPKIPLIGRSGETIGQGGGHWLVWRIPRTLVAGVCQNYLILDGVRHSLNDFDSWEQVEAEIVKRL